VRLGLLREPNHPTMEREKKDLQEKISNYGLHLLDLIYQQNQGKRTKGGEGGGYFQLRDVVE